jgi:hypothetical protein
MDLRRQHRHEIQAFQLPIVAIVIRAKEEERSTIRGALFSIKCLLNANWCDQITHSITS